MVGQFIRNMTMFDTISIPPELIIWALEITVGTVDTLVNLVTNPADADLGATPAEVAAMAEAEVVHPRHMDD